MTDRLIRTEDDGPVRIVRLDSPKTRNSLTMEFRAQLGEAVEAARDDARVRAVYLTAEGPTFCSGGDLNHLKTACDPWTVHRRFQGLQRWLVPLMQLDKPVVVGVNGHAVGGGMGLALAGDLVIAPYARGGTITAIRRGGSGDVTTSHVAWTRKDIGADVPTPAVRDGRIVVCTDKGVVEGLDAACSTR